MMRTIDFTTAQDAEVGNKIDVFIPFFDKNIGIVSISDYSDSLNGLVFIFQCFQNVENGRKVEQFKTLRHKTKTLELYLILDYEKIMNVTDLENLGHIKDVFAKGCETFLKPLKDFKYNEFVEKISC